MNIPTPYDVIIEGIKAVSDDDWSYSLGKQLDQWQTLQGAFRSGHNSGALAERAARRDAEMAGKAAWEPPKDNLDRVGEEMDAEIEGGTCKECLPGQGHNQPDAPPRYSPHVGPRLLYIPDPPWAKEHPGQRVSVPTLNCDNHPDGCPGPAVDDTALRMVKVDAPGFKGEHTGRAKLEYWPDHDHALAVQGMCPCQFCSYRQ